jgi:hypothetical protein
MRCLLLCLAMLITTPIWADEPADRAAIARTISTFDGSTAPELARLLKPTIRISHEAWGEADVHIPPTHAVLGTLTFLTSEVAMADVTYAGGPVLMVMKKERGMWKIASIRVLAP